MRSRGQRSGRTKARRAREERHATHVADAVRGVLIGLDGRCFALAPGQSYRLGRDPACDLVVLDALASRAHCRIDWDAQGCWVVSDLGSANGTRVNGGLLVAPHALADGDLLAIGGQEYRFRFVPPGADPASLADAAPDARKRTVPLDAPALAEAPPSLAGRLADTGLAELFCYLALCRANGRLRIDGEAAWVDVVAGVPRRAAVTGSAGAEGLHALRLLAERARAGGDDAPGVFAFHHDAGIALEPCQIDRAPESIALAVFGPEGAPFIDPGDLARAGAQQRRSMAATSVAGVEVGVCYQGLCGVSGDFYDLATLADGRVLAVVGDVAGHGVQAALVVAGLLRGLRHLGRHADDLRRLAGDLDQDLRGDLLPGQYCTAGFVALDPVSGAVEALLAGHHPARVLVPGQLPRPLGRSGPALGMKGLRLDPARALVDRTVLAAGQTVVLFSDALLEAADEGGRQFGEHGLEAALGVLAEAGDLSAGVARLAERCRSFAGAVDDDLTVLALRRA